MAADACNRNKIEINNTVVKPSRVIKTGDKFSVHIGSLIRTFEVIAIPPNRVSAKELMTYCKETTPQEEILKHQALQKAAALWRDKGAGRPTKKERRELDDFIWDGNFGEI
jgi:ribosome-associated heat shock protein Hsp15